MTKEDLIGRSFIASDKITYSITDTPNKDAIMLNWKSPLYPDGRSSSWNLPLAIEAIEEGRWKLLPIENKMYKTPKGIEYGVGTVFTHRNDVDNPEGTVYTITGISNDKIDLSWKNDGKMKQYYTLEQFNTYVTNGDWVIITPMKDYKQVDPKTITFDFTNTKIKVNNEDESKWIQEVAFNNKWSWLSGYTEPTYTECGALYFSDKNISKSDTAGTFFIEQAYKEITIQDILSNMKEVIEVGDIVVLNNYQKEDQYEVTSITFSTAYLVNLGNWDSALKGDIGQNPLSGLKLFKKSKKKEIIGYETVVDLPGIPKGTKTSEKYTSAGWKFGQLSGVNNATLYVKNGEIDNTKFFKPIYKQDAIELKFSKYTATLSKEEGLVFTDGEKLTYKEVASLLKRLEAGNSSLGQFGRFKVDINYAVTKVTVGCKSFTPDDVRLVADAIKKLDE